MSGSRDGAEAAWTPVTRLRLDPTACDGIGICAHLAPSLVTVDSWGYPLIAPGPLLRHHHRAARSAVAGCPRRALFLDDQGPQG